MTDEQVLALLVIVAQDHPNQTTARQDAADALVWARTEGYAEVLRRVRDYNAAVAKSWPIPCDASAVLGECCNGCGDGKHCGKHCAKGQIPDRPVSYEEEHITFPSGLPRSSTKE